jgi:hypothetical protein
MQPASARKWLVISALVVGGVWAYRRWREGPVSTLTKFPEFITGWGATYFILSMITEAAPGFGGSFALLIMVGDLLYNAKPGAANQGLLADFTLQQSGKPASATPLDTTSPASPVAGAGTTRVPSPGAGNQGAASAGESAAAATSGQVVGGVIGGIL